MERRPGICHYCRRPVIWASISAGRGKLKPIAIEVCSPGRGDMALVPSLFDDGQAPLVELVSNGTRYRSHREHCTSTVIPARAFSRVDERKKQRC